MKVYLLSRFEGYEHPEILSVHKTRSGADAAQEECDRKVQAEHAALAAKYADPGYGERDLRWTYEIEEMDLFG